MKQFLIYLLLLCAPLLVAQETVLTHEMGDEAARGKINRNFDTVYIDVANLVLEIDTINVRVDSSKAVFNYEDSTAIIITLEVDTAELSYIKIDPAMAKILFFSLSKMKKGVGNPPADGVEQGFFTLDFDKTTDEETFGTFFGPLDWKPNSEAQIHLGFFVDVAPVTADTVVWGAEFTSIVSDGIFNFASTITALDSVQITAGTPANDKKVHNSTIIIPSINLTEEGVLMLRIYRDANNGADSHNADARIFDFHIHYTRDKI